MDVRPFSTRSVSHQADDAAVARGAADRTRIEDITVDDREGGTSDGDGEGRSAAATDDDDVAAGILEDESEREDEQVSADGTSAEGTPGEGTEVALEVALPWRPGNAPRHPVTSERAEATREDGCISKRAPEGGSSSLSVLERLLQTARRDEETDKRNLMELPAGHRIKQCEQWRDSRLVELMTSFRAEDSRVGSSQMTGRIEWPNLVHLLIREAGSRGARPLPAEAVAYVWSQLSSPHDGIVDEANLPRIHHLYVSKGCRKAQFGRRLLNWWRSRHALTVEAFAVTKPNQPMHRLLQRNGCTHALQRSGFEGSAEHFHALGAEGGEPPAACM